MTILLQGLMTADGIVDLPVGTKMYRDDVIGFLSQDMTGAACVRNNGYSFGEWLSYTLTLWSHKKPISSKLAEVEKKLQEARDREAHLQREKNKTAKDYDDAANDRFRLEEEYAKTAMEENLEVEVELKNGRVKVPLGTSLRRGNSRGILEMYPDGSLFVRRGYGGFKHLDPHTKYWELNNI